MTDFTRRPLTERKVALEAKLQARLPPSIYQNLKDLMAFDAMKFRLMPLLLKRDLWEEFWAVYRDTIEDNAELVLLSAEKTTAEKGLFE